MRMHTVTRSVIAGLAISATCTEDAKALNLNPLGTGQVLVFPYYTVNAGNQTVLSVVNKTDAGKAIKVRFLEGRNSREVLDFNVYLSPFDVWTATAFSLSDTGPNNPGNLLSLDNSCTVPRIKGNPALPMLANGNRYAPFFNYSYSGSNKEAGPDTLDRTREGHFELIEMGEVVNRENTSLTAITHGATGVPANCLLVERAWLPASAGASVAYWTLNPAIDLEPPQGGLFGSVSIIDALAGTMMSYNADAIDAFSDIAQHTNPGSSLPSLASARTNADTAVAQVFNDGVIVNSIYPIARAIDAVSALFVQDQIDNEFVTSASMGGASEWVVTFPTKFAYVDQAIVGSTPIAPFTRIFPILATNSIPGTAAVDVKGAAFNREELRMPVDPCAVPVQPQCVPFLPPPSPTIFVPQLAWSSNVISFNQARPDVFSSDILGSHLVSDFNTQLAGFSEGWANLSLYDELPRGGSLAHLHRMRPDQSGAQWSGLPTTGFLAVSFTNGQLTPGVLSNYAAAFKHRGSNRYGMPP